MAFHCTQTASTQSKDLYESRRNILVKSSGGKSVRPYEPTMREDVVPIEVLTIFSEWLSGHGASDSYDVNWRKLLNFEFESTSQWLISSEPQI
jgi:hypothetical protein